MRANVAHLRHSSNGAVFRNRRLLNRVMNLILTIRMLQALENAADTACSLPRLYHISDRDAYLSIIESSQLLPMNPARSPDRPISGLLSRRLGIEGQLSLG